jgi:hypothetical protein
MPRFSPPILFLAIVLAGCAGMATGAPSDAGAATASVEPRRPTVALEVTGGPAAGIYASDPASSLNICTQAADGSWLAMYGGGQPWINVDLLVGSRAAEPGRSSDVALEITAGAGYLWIDQGGFRGGDAKGRSQVSVEIHPTADTVTLVVTATTPNRTPSGDGARSGVALTVTCPV